MDTSEWPFTARGRTLYARLPNGELMPYRRWRRLREEHRDCCPQCPVRKRVEQRRL